MASPGVTSSSPVEKMATRGLRHTKTSARPIAAREPISRELKIWPARNRVSPRAMSPPATATDCPGGTGRRTSTSNSAPRSSVSVSSIMTMASAPRGSIPPVAMIVAVPSATVSRGSTPGVNISELRRSTRGCSLVAPAVSAARTAKPSMLDRSNPGTSMPATTSRERTRPTTFMRETTSSPSGAKVRCFRKRASASARSMTSRNCSWRAALCIAILKSSVANLNSSKVVPALWSVYASSEAVLKKLGQNS